VTTYPPPPWHLAGHAFVSAWRVPVAALPALPVSAYGLAPVVVAGTAVVLTPGSTTAHPGG
jgi:hypothetical protein